jgi:hypothetical protein
LVAADHLREPATGRFVAGHAPHPAAGRPRKGQTIADRVAKADAAVARKAIRARDKRLELTNAVGERAWATYLAYNLGLPAQKFILSQGVSEADALDAILLANQGNREAVEGEYVVQPQAPGD